MWWLIFQMLGFIVLAAVLGLILGYLIWGGRRSGSVRIRELESQLAAAQGRLRDQAAASEPAAAIAALEAERDAAVEARIKAEAQLADKVAAAGDAMPDPAPAPAPDPPAPASLLTERPDIVDDLKRIKGVGPVMESVLNDKGVYLYHQLAHFSADDIAWVNAAIDAFPGRIERDRWVEQARTLYAETYGKAYDAD